MIISSWSRKENLVSLAVTFPKLVAVDKAVQKIISLQMHCSTGTGHFANLKFTIIMYCCQIITLTHSNPPFDSSTSVRGGKDSSRNNILEFS